MRPPRPKSSRPRTRAVAPSAPAVTAQNKSVTVRPEFFFRYLLSLPPGYSAQSSRRWPVLFFFHGRGERGDNLEDLKKHGPPRLIAEGQSLPFIVVSPQCSEQEAWWNYLALEAFVDDVVQRYRVDPTRIYLTGLSMGGFATWALAQHRPDFYAAIAPICGGGDERLAAFLHELPVWAFHGTADLAIPVKRTNEMIAAIRQAGGSPQVTLYRGVGHDSWTKTYENPALYTWLLSHQRKRATAHT